MAVDRPTFSESWYRVKSLRPRLRSTVQIFRQYYRGQMWHVVRDPSNEQFFRLNDAAYHFVGLLNGERTVASVWDICNEHLEDRAPTQREAIELLGQLYASNLLASELPADAAGMFDRYKKRIRREIGGYLQNFLFVRVPLIDPDAFLDRWVKIFGVLFTKTVLFLWMALLVVGLSFIFRSPAGFEGLLDQSRSENVLDPKNLIWLYMCMAFIKLFHEFGHGFACKKFGRDVQSGGEVHTMGIMFLVFFPVPYVDATNSWALRSKWQRMVVGAAGIFVELAIAAVAAIVWSQTSPGSLTHSLAFNVIFLASVSTILFNGNPLLRFDAYYIMADLLEIANLSQRSKEYIYYLVKKYAYGVERPRNPAHSPGERFWLLLYGVTSAVYRVFIYVGILLFVADKAAIVGAILAVGGIVTWVIKPLVKWGHYLTTSPELMRTRPRAVSATLGFVLVLVTILGIFQFEEHDRAEGVVEARNRAVVFMTQDGFVDETMATQQQVEPGGQALLSAHDEELDYQLEQLEAEYRRLQAQLRLATAPNSGVEIAVRDVLTQNLDQVQQNIDRTLDRIQKLRVDPPIAGTWIAPDADDLGGTFLPRGQPVGEVINFDDLIIRAVARQELGPRIKERLVKVFGYQDVEDQQSLTSATAASEQLERMKVDIRFKGRPDMRLSGTVEEISVGQQELPYPSLGIAAGGSMLIDITDQNATRTPEKFFEVRIGDLVDHEGNPLELNHYIRQRVMVRFDLGVKPLAVQWWWRIRQLLQRRLHLPL